MFLATNAICETRHTRQGRQSTIDANAGIKRFGQFCLLRSCRWLLPAAAFRLSRESRHFPAYIGLPFI